MSTNHSYNQKELLLRLEVGDKSAFDTRYYHFEPRLRLFLYPFTRDQHGWRRTIDDLIINVIAVISHQGIRYIERQSIT